MTRAKKRPTTRRRGTTALDYYSTVPVSFEIPAITAAVAGRTIVTSQLRTETSKVVREERSIGIAVVAADHLHSSADSSIRHFQSNIDVSLCPN